MEKRLKNYIDENVEDLKTQLDQLHDRFVTNSANGKGTTQSMRVHYIEMLGKVDQRMQKIQEELHRNLEAAIAERLNANKKRSASAAFGDIDDSEKLTNAQQPLIRNHSGALEMNLESHQMVQIYPFMQFGKRFEFQLNNAQTHLESAVCEMKSGTYKRLTGLDERVGAMEEKMNKMILLMEKMEASNVDKSVVS